MGSDAHPFDQLPRSGHRFGEALAFACRADGRQMGGATRALMGVEGDVEDRDVGEVAATAIQSVNGCARGVSVFVT